MAAIAHESVHQSAGKGNCHRATLTNALEADLSPERLSLLHDYRLVQHDFSVGARSAVDDMWYPFAEGS